MWTVSLIASCIGGFLEIVLLTETEISSVLSTFDHVAISHRMDKINLCFSKPSLEDILEALVSFNYSSHSFTLLG